jgi:putative membrane protein
MKLFESSREFMTTLLKGIIIGIANLIPGVSGGTMALILGIYERMITALNNITLTTFISFFKLFTLSKQSRDDFMEEMKKIDFIFLLTVIFGALIAVALFVKLMVVVLVDFHDPTYGFFWGLVLPSIYVPFIAVKKRSASVFVALVFAALLVIASGSILSDDQIIEKEQIKYELELAELNGSSPASSFSVFDALLLGASGAVAVSAMILPGVSGSFVLLLMGQYFVLLEAISTLNIPYLGIFAIGIVAGLLLFTKLLYYLLENFHDTSMGFLSGLVAGSLWVIWPFKNSAVIGTSAVEGYPETVYLSNTLPQTFALNEILTVITTLIGILIVIVMIRLDNKKNNLK